VLVLRVYKGGLGVRLFVGTAESGGVHAGALGVKRRVFEQASHSQAKRHASYQQMQTVCSRCKGLGVCIPEKERCTCCAGKRVIVAPTVLSVTIERGAPAGSTITLKGQANERPGAKVSQHAPTAPPRPAARPRGRPGLH
jgi:hypothetical protein